MLFTCGIAPPGLDSVRAFIGHTPITEMVVVNIICVCRNMRALNFLGENVFIVILREAGQDIFIFRHI